MMYHITYLSDGLKVKGYLSLPYGFGLPISELQSSLSQFYGSSDLPIRQISRNIHPEEQDIRQRKWPVLIYCRGGIGRVGSVKTDWLEQFSNHGHIIFAPSYRGNEGGEGRDEFGGQDQEDVFSAYRFLESLPFVDSDRISVMGFSRGSINAAHTAVQMRNVCKTIFWGGVSDLAKTYEERIDLRRMLKRVIGGSPAKKPEAYEARSPIYMAERIQSPVLIMHGTQDIQVDFSHGLNMYNKLKKLGTNTEFHRYEGYGHHMPPDIHKLAIERMFKWINNN
ncbi:prolyl oligopeptidase family serine peptidase [Paenibacillus sediminis]|uniref:Dipeptidyl aminopeptidase/acylaminoacyl peptidase n=1 Tax=Paenibacillus sediminis TaxID=664909 RepID=A0ABS4H0X6_9BACL|nr:prolyl oligopeptidase family serine peptidase [Paenibacillus sediminis]MBP1936179.1 dipeptidyl aminopeptidase/acylaminoacyl peptidase [Paenibacillus sediminis]